MKSRKFEKFLGVLLCILFIVLVFSLAFSAFHHCENPNSCLICSNLKCTFNYFVSAIMPAMIVSGIFLSFYKLKINKIFSLVEKCVRINS